MTIVKGLRRCDIFLELSTQKILNVMAYFSSSNPKGMPIAVVTTCNILVGNFYFIFCGGYYDVWFANVEMLSINLYYEYL